MDKGVRPALSLVPVSWYSIGQHTKILKCVNLRSTVCGAVACLAGACSSSCNSQE